MATKKILTDLHIGGKVGVGTTSPSEKLEVIGYVKSSSGFRANTYTYLLESDNDTVISNSAYYNMLFKTNNAERMRITNAGNVGIGTNNPIVKLDVVGTARFADVSPRIVLQETGTAKDFSLKINTDGRLSFLNDDLSSEVLTIKQDGNVGIGTISPNFALDVNGDIRIEDTHKFFLGGSGGTADWFTQATGTGLNFAENGVADYRLFLKNGGNVGIGTNNPGYKLDVSGGLRATGESTFTNNLLFSDNSIIKMGNSGDFEIYHNSTTNSNLIQSNLSRQLILAQDNIFIGNQAASESIITGVANGSVSLFYDNSKKFETTSIGISVTGGVTATGTVTGSNLSGTNTGDQDLSGYLLNTTDNFTGTLNILGGNNNSKESFFHIKRGSGAGEWLKFQTDSTTANNVSQFVIRRNSDNVDLLSIKTSNGAITLNGALTASNLSGTNTGDQDLSSFLTSSSTQSKYLRSDADDVTNSNIGLNQDKKITFDSNSDGFNYIRTISATDGYRPAGVMVYGSVGGHHFIDGEDGAYDNVFASGFKKDGGTASQFLKADGSVDSNTYVSGDEYRKYYQIDYTEHIALSDESTALTTGTSKVTFRSLGNIKASMFRLSCNTAPTGSVITVDINVDGVSILSTKLTIDAGEKTSRTAANAMQFATGLDAISDDAEITVDIDGVGSTIAGAGLKLIMYYNHSVLIP
jgi:hypothetical protein